MGRASALLTTPRAAAIVALSVVLGVYYSFNESLPNLTVWWEVAILAFLVIPACFGLVYLALPLWRAPHLLPAGLVVGVLAAVLEIVGFDVAANFAKLAAVTLLAFYFLTYFETAAWVMAVALIIPWVDAYSVWRGPTKHIIEQRRELFTTFSFAFPVPGEQSTAQLGLPDLMFFALFLAATARWGLRTRLTWARDGPLLRRDDGPHRLLRSERAAGASASRARLSPPERRPALEEGPRRRTRGARSDQATRSPPARSFLVARPSRCAACAGTCPRAGRVRACSPTRPGAP